MAVIGGGPAGLAAASASAAAGARTLVLERAEHPRYKTCGGGLLGVSRAAVAGQIALPVRDEIRSATFTLRGGQEFTRSHPQPLLTMVMRDEFDAALLGRAQENGAEVRQRAQVRAIEQADGRATARLADGSSVTATVLIGADGSSGVTARHVGAQFAQVDLGLELEIAVPEAVAARWTGRLLLDWGAIPGSYGWVFPKGDRLTVGVIAARGQGDATKAYLREFIGRLGWAATRRSGTPATSPAAGPRSHRCAAGASSSRATRPACSSRGPARASASRSAPARSRASTPPRPPPRATRRPRSRPWTATRPRSTPPWSPTCRPAGCCCPPSASTPGTFHKGLSTGKGWGAFVKFCRSERSFAELVNHPAARLALSLISRVLRG